MAKTNAAAQAKGQKNLFSFFSKKPPAVKPAAAASSSAAPFSSNKDAASKKNDTSSKKPTSRPPNNNNVAQPTPSQLKLLQKVTVGTKLAVFWPDDNEYYPCVVTRHRVRAERGDPGEFLSLIHVKLLK